MATVYDWRKTDCSSLSRPSAWMVERILGKMKEEIKKARQPQTARDPLLHPVYVPLLHTINKYLPQKWDKAVYEMHRKGVKAAKPIVNTGPPEICRHMTLNQKKHEIEAMRAVTIQRENNILREKISHIMRTPGRADNTNYYIKKQLGSKKRQLEMLSIAKKNKKIQFRLSQCKPYYSVRSWHKDWLRTLEVMERIAHYPRDRANQQKGQEKPDKMNRKCGKEQKQTKDANTRSPAHAGNEKKCQS
ncbi:uncharacterized protein cfap97d2 [Archocentrus centrarchus]|uniref:uncharacterized protein cfap97d2 n=1 Tax=Archocentrus centrarchus TaxID=63155 RepID=UPI0011EA3B81|nr:uncharacterized protein LOC115800317 [Archocentrus centrarchus]